MQSAQEVATKMGEASDALKQATSVPITKADKTTLTVNTKAQEANDEAIKLADLFLTHFQQTIENIQSVAKEFERTDEELEGAIKGLVPHFGNSEDKKTYERAKNG